MKNKSFIIVLLLLNAVACLAQGPAQQLKLMAGPSFPVGAFAKTDLYDGTSGFAKTGIAATLIYSYPLNKNWSVLLSAAAQQNPLNTTAFEKDFASTGIRTGIYTGTGTGNPPPGGYTVYPNWHFEGKSWFTGSLHLGIQLEPGKNSTKGWFTLAGGLGASYVILPYIKGTSFTDTATAQIEETKKSAVGFSYHTAAGFNYPLSKKIFLATSVIYSGTGNITFKGVQSTVYTTKGTYGNPDYTVQKAISTFNSRQKTGTISLLLGIGLRL